MTGARVVTATFTSPNPLFTLTITPAGTGSGTVSSSPLGISCGTDCSEPYASGTVVTLTAAPASGSTFDGWSGCDTASGATCTVTMSGVRMVGATFSAEGVILAVNPAASGGGSVTPRPRASGARTD